MTPESKARREWAYGFIRRCPSPPPAYGTAEWHRLPDGPEKVASVVIAAESWALDGDFLYERLRAEVEFEREAFKTAEDAAYLDRARGHAQSWDPKLPGFRSDPQIAAEIEREWAQWAGGDCA